MSGTWINRVRHVSDGEPVNGAIDSRPTRTLEGNAQYLKDRIDSAELGEAVCAYGETVKDDVLLGMAVYRNNDTSRYERALASVEEDKDTHVLVQQPSCDCVGIVVFKHNATKADILLAGRRQVDITAAVGTIDLDAKTLTPMPGRYYLSSATAGILVRQRPAVSVSVLIYTDDGLAIVQPVQRDFLEDHIHYKIKLFAQPAGTNVTYTDGGGHQRHRIDNAATNLPGWLPANHALFAGTAPTGAAFGYNLTQHDSLARVFPPVPASGAAVYIDRGKNQLGATMVPMGPGGLCSVDQFGVWWMSDGFGDVPWPDTWTVPITDQTGNAPTGPEAPRIEDFQVILSYTMMVFTTERTTVTSLQAAPDSPELKFTDCDGNEAATGDLLAHLDLEFLVDPHDDTDDIMAFKQLDGVTFKRGPIVEGLLAGTDCALSSANTRLLEDGTTTLYQGRVTVNLNTTAGERELPADLVRLAQTEERYYLDIPYIGFDAGRDTSLRMRFYVPTDLATGFQVGLRMQLLGRSAGTLPQLTVSYRIIPRPMIINPPPAPPTPMVPPPTLPDMNAEKAMDIDTNVVITQANQYIEVNGTPFPVTAGDTILVNLVRNNNDGYGGEVGLMRPTGILTAVPATGP